VPSAQIYIFTKLSYLIVLIFFVGIMVLKQNPYHEASALPNETPSAINIYFWRFCWILLEYNHLVLAEYSHHNGCIQPTILHVAIKTNIAFGCFPYLN